jgi:plasmid stabilization system protein ParE
MNKYTVVVTERAQEDLCSLSDVISHEYKSPLTAKRYLERLYDEIRKLSKSAESYPVQTRQSLLLQ